MPAMGEQMTHQDAELPRSPYAAAVGLVTRASGS